MPEKEKENKRYAPLRPEARPVEYSKLDESQKKAFDRLVGMLTATMEELRGQGLRATPAWLDYRLSSRMAFLQGDRGTGKSTVLLSLVHACMGTEPPDPTVAGLEKLRCGRVVFLEPIDMARFPPGPGTANLLAQVLARIEDAVQPFVFGATAEHGGRDIRREPRGMLGRCPEGRDPLLLLQRLQTAVATAWDGNLRDRGGQIDADVYAVEVMRAERERMTFNVKLSQVVDALAALVPCTAPPGPLFVVSLDDVDLNPLRCLEALRLLHLLAVPRLFTIVLGDMSMVELALHLEYSGEFSVLVGHHSSENLISMAARDVATRVAQISANTIRKLLPAAQRIRLRPMTRHDALYFRPFGMEGDQVPPLHVLLHRCPAAISTDDPPRMCERDIYSLRDFLLYRARENRYDLRVMSVAAINELVDDGRNLVIVALVGTELHIRMFDANGKKVVDKAESELVSGDTLTALKRRLNSFLDESGLSQEDKQEIIRNATSIASHTLEKRTSEPNGKEITDEAPVTDEQLEACTYTASQILHMPARWAADWWQLLKVVDERYPCVPKSQARPGEKWGTQEKRDKKWNEVIDLLGRHLRSMIAEDPTLTAEHRRRFREGLRRSSTSGEWELSFPVRSMPETGPSLILFVGDLGFVPIERRILVHAGHGWRLQPGKTSTWRPPTTVDPEKLDEKIRQALEASFSPPTTWGLVLLYDLLSLGPTWKSGATLWIYRPLELWGFTEWNVSSTKRIFVAWPAPMVLSYWEYDIFLSYWNSALAHIFKIQSYGEQASIEACVYAWLDAGAAILVREKPLWAPETLEKCDWNALIKRIAGNALAAESVIQIAKRRDPRGNGTTKWLIRLAHFLWPTVSGIQKETADLFFNDGDLCKFWQENLPAIDQYVKEILGHSKKKGLKDEDAEKLRKDWDDYRTSIRSHSGGTTSKPELPPPLLGPAQPRALGPAQQTSKPESTPRKPRRPR